MLVSALLGCANVELKCTPRTVPISIPECEKIITANVGEELVTQGIRTEVSGIYIEKDLEATGILNHYKIAQGQYDNYGGNEEYNYYLPAPGCKGVYDWGLSDGPKVIITSKDDKEIGVMSVYGAAHMTSAINIKKRNRYFFGANNFQQTLIYTGKFGEKIRIAYRESSNNNARPAFNNDMEYDLRESRVIGYKGARIEIIEATNESITYKVIKNFTPVTL